MVCVIYSSSRTCLMGRICYCTDPAQLPTTADEEELLDDLSVDDL